MQNRSNIYFIITDHSLIKKYCSAILVYEKTYILDDQDSHCSQFLLKQSYQELESNVFRIYQNIRLIYLPKVILLISRMPIFKVHQQMLNYIANHQPSLEFLLTFIFNLDNTLMFKNLKRQNHKYCKEKSIELKVINNHEHLVNENIKVIYNDSFVFSICKVQNMGLNIP